MSLRDLAAIAICALACVAPGCHTSPPSAAAIDPALARCIPPGSILIAGVDLAALRRSPLYADAPLRAFAAQLDEVSFALAAYDGKGLLIAAHGDFPSPPAGAIMLQPNLALYGSPEQVALAEAQYKSGHAAASALLAKADAVAPDTQIWIVARGDAPLPLTGNAANLTRILRKANLVTLTVRTGSGLALELQASAPSGNAARAIEETLRADFTLAAAAEAKRVDVAAALKSIQISRTNGEVRVTLAVSDEVAHRLLQMLK
jgi:hypothetical protein